MREAAVALADATGVGAPGLEALCEQQRVDLVCADPATERVLYLAERVADTDASVMISGESGTGKELFARFIHSRSTRAPGPFVAVNCAAIPASLLEATLFGYERGAFTGAHQAYQGKFEQAQQGTLLLDEITEMDLELQAKLLRVLQERELERLGGRHTIPLDVRILATTNRELRDLVAAGDFRVDLYYRLNVFPLTIPPLRERVADILPLATHRVRWHVPPGRQAPRFTRSAEKKLLSHDWPGNVRELDNVIQRALILQAGPWIDAAEICIEPLDLPRSCGPALGSSEPSASAAFLGDDLRQRERDLIVEALEATRGNREAAARRLGMSARTLRYRIARLRRLGFEMPVVLTSRRG